MRHRCHFIWRGPETTERHWGLARVELLIVSILGLILLSLFLVFLPRHRENALRMQCVNHLRRLGDGVHSYHKTNAMLPPARIADGYATWAVLLAPHLIDDHPLLEWDNAKPFLDQTQKSRQTPLSVFFCPARRRSSAVGTDGALGDFAAVAGNGDPKRPWTGPDANGPMIVGETLRRDADLILAWNSRTSFDSLKRGLSPTLLMGDKHVPTDRLSEIEAGDGSLYDGRPPSSSSRAAGPGFGLARSPKAPMRDNFGSSHAYVCQFLNADGSVRAFVFVVEPELLGRLATRD